MGTDHTDCQECKRLWEIIEIQQEIIDCPDCKRERETTEKMLERQQEILGRQQEIIERLSTRLEEYAALAHERIALRDRKEMERTAKRRAWLADLRALESDKEGTPHVRDPLQRIAELVDELERLVPSLAPQRVVELRQMENEIRLRLERDPAYENDLDWELLDEILTTERDFWRLWPLAQTGSACRAGAKSGGKRKKLSEAKIACRRHEWQALVEEIMRKNDVITYKAAVGRVSDMVGFGVRTVEQYTHKPRRKK